MTCFGYSFKLNIDGTNKWQIQDLKSKKTEAKLFDRLSPSWTPAVESLNFQSRIFIYGIYVYTLHK